jgi:hypothetical protein
MLAREVNNTVPLGTSFAELFRKPSSVMPSRDCEITETPVFGISVGVSQTMSPPKYSWIFRDGVPPPTNVATLSSVVHVHPSGSGQRPFSPVAVLSVLVLFIMVVSRAETSEVFKTSEV